MVHADTALWLGAVAAGSTALSGLAVWCRRYWDEPGGQLFSATLLGFAATATLAGVSLVRNPAETGPAFAAFQAALYATPLLWGGYTAQRTGIPGITRRWTYGAVALLVTSLAATTTSSWVAERAGVELPSTVGSAVGALIGVMLFATLLVSLAAFVLGVGLVVYSVVEYEHVTPRRGASIALPAVVGWCGPVLASNMLRSDDPDVALATAVVGASAVGSAAGFWLAVTRYEAFAQAVAAGVIGRDEVVETMEDAVVVVDDAGAVVDTNPAAERLFEVEMGDAARAPVAAVLGEPLSELRTAERVALDTIVGVREFEPRASVVTGAGGDVVGFSIVLRDVTERRTREQRLQVLNRVLRHNLRNEVSVISGYAELLGETGATVALDRAASEITETAYELAEIGEKARTIERMMAEPPNGTEPVAVYDAVDRAVEPVADDHPDCEVAVDVPDDLEVAANTNVLVPVLENLVENAAEHNDRPEPHVEVRASRGVDPSTVTVTVVDDGPGIPEGERAVLESGDVTPLEHGSGLGLWVAKWGVTRLGGELSFSATEPRGTIVTVRLPVEGPPEEDVEVVTGRMPA